MLRYVKFLFLLTFLFFSLVNVFPQDVEEEFFKLEEEIAVSALKHEQKVSLTPATIYVYSQKDFRFFGYNELNELLDIIPGIDKYDPEFWTIGGQRGFVGAFDTTLVMIDGVEVNNLIAGEAFISKNYPLQPMKRVEVIQGPASALYGANAVGGIINLVTKNPEDINGIETSLSIGSWNTFISYLGIGIVQNTWNYKLFVRTYFTDGPNFYKEVNDISNFGYGAENKAYRLQITEDLYSDPTHSIFVYSKFSFEGIKPLKFYIGGLFNYILDGRGVAEVQQVYIGDYDGRLMWNVYTGVDINWSEKYSTTIQWKFWKDYLWGSHTQQDWVYGLDANGYPDFSTTNTNPTLPAIETVRGYYSNLKKGSMRTMLELQNNFSFYENLRSIFGFSIDYIGVYEPVWNQIYYSTLVNGPTNVVTPNPNIPESNFAERLKYGGYVQIEYIPLPFLYSILGTRVDYFSFSNKWEVNPRVGFILKPWEELSIKLLYGEAYREPSVFEEYKATQEGKLQEIHSSKIQTLELSSFYNRLNIIETSFSIYYNIGSNIKISIPEPGGGVKEVERLEIIGGEVEVKLNLLKNLQLFLNATYEQGKQYTATEISPLYGIPALKGNIGLSYSIWERVYLGIVGHYIGPIEMLEARPYKTFPPYFILNLNLLIQEIYIMRNRISLSLNVKNLLDTEWKVPNPRGGSYGLNPSYFPQAPRSISISISSSF